MLISKKILSVLILIFSFTDIAFSQPFIFKSIEDTTSDDGPFNSIIKINLSNGSKELYKYYSGDDVTWDNTQSWVVDGQDDFTISSSIDTNLNFYCPYGPKSVVYSIIKNKMFVLGTGDKYDLFSIINTLSKKIELSFNISSYERNGQVFLSSDENIIYLPFYDTIFIPIRSDKLKIAYLSTSTNRIVRTRNLSDIGYTGADAYVVSNGKNGIAIIHSYFRNQSKDTYYNIYNFDIDSSSAFIYHAGDSEPYFTNKGKYLILNDSFDSLAYDGSIAIPQNSGKFYIFNLAQRKLVKTIQLPPKRTVYTFDNFPDNIYYYDDNTETAIILNIDSLITKSTLISDLTPSVTFPGLQNFTLEIKGSNFSTNSGVLWNGNERTTTFVSDSLLHAEILSSDISRKGISLVTLKTGYDISDTLTFSVVDSLTMPIHPILECAHNNGNGTYTAHFGYQNDLDKTVLVPIGGQNSFSSGQSDRGQPTLFYPGRHTDVLTVNFDGRNIAWILDMQMISASSSSPPCN